MLHYADILSVHEPRSLLLAPVLLLLVVSDIRAHDEPDCHVGYEGEQRNVVIQGSLLGHGKGQICIVTIHYVLFQARVCTIQYGVLRT